MDCVPSGPSVAGDADDKSEKVDSRLEERENRGCIHFLYSQVSFGSISPIPHIRSDFNLF